MTIKTSVKNAKKQTDTVVSLFSKKIKEITGENLKQIILFGSRARGDNHDYSDYDFIIVLYNKNSVILDKIRSIEVEMMETCNVLVSALVFTIQDWIKRQSLPLGLNVRREGIDVG